jgi:hypothetical protein
MEVLLLVWIGNLILVLPEIWSIEPFKVLL